jgi:hypothetical protein
MQMKHQMSSFTYANKTYQQLIISEKSYELLSLEEKKSVMKPLIDAFELYYGEEEGATLKDVLEDFGWLEANWLIKQP